MVCKGERGRNSEKYDSGNRLTHAAQMLLPSDAGNEDNSQLSLQRV